MHMKTTSPPLSCLPACLCSPRPTQAKYAGFGMIEPRVRLDFDQLGLTLPGKGKVLEGVSGESLRTLPSLSVCLSTDYQWPATIPIEHCSWTEPVP
jgi:hypothetical protein